MGRQKLDPETRKAIRSAKSVIEAVAESDGNEAETRQRVERIFEWVMGYDVFEHISREHAVHGAGDTEHCDFAIQIGKGESAKPLIMVELKRVNVKLAPKHLKQVSHYAINVGCEWVLLTNGREWKLYHVSYGQPPETKLIERWDIVEDDTAAVAQKFSLISYRNVKRGGLDALWEKRNVLTPRNVLGIILSEGSLKLMRRELKKASGVNVTPEEIVGGVRRLLNETALTEIDNIKISLPERKKRRPRSATRPSEETPAGEGACDEEQPSEQAPTTGETQPEQQQ